MYCLDNEALYDICYRNLRLKLPTYADHNHLLSLAMSLATSYRFSGNSNLRSLCNNLIPFPRLHFYTPSLAPLFARGTQAPVLSEEEVFHSVRMSSFHSFIELNLTLLKLFDSKCSLVSCDPRQGKYLAGVGDFRGNVTINPNEYLVKVSKLIVFIPNLDEYSSSICDWIPDNLKWSYSQFPPLFGGRAGVMTSNTTGELFLWIVCLTTKL